jgi:GTP cyclohydrolase I
VEEPVREYDSELVSAGIAALLDGCGEDRTREGLAETPARVARFYRQWMAGDPFTMTTFDAEGADEMIVQQGIPFAALCEHHLLPFLGTATVGYVPDGRIVGLSKLARAVRHCARGFQNQERITRSVADLLERELRPRGVAVLIRAEHLCMSIRGVRAPGSMTTTNDLRGVFRAEDGLARAEFLSLAIEGRK